PMNGAANHSCNGHAVPPKAKKKSSTNWGNLAARFAREISDEQVQALADQLHVVPIALRELGVGWDGRLYTFPMFAADGSVCGVRTRHPKTGEKKAWSRSNLGVIKRAKPDDGLLLVCEGESDTAAALTLGFDAIGRPGVTTCADVASVFARDRDVG